MPLSFVTFLGAAAWAWALADAPRIDNAARWVMFAVGGVLPLAWFVGRVVYAFRHTRLLHLGADGRQFTLPFVERHLEKR